MQSHRGKDLLFLSNAELSNKIPIPKGEKKYGANMFSFQGSDTLEDDRVNRFHSDATWGACESI